MTVNCNVDNLLSRGFSNLLIWDSARASPRERGPLARFMGWGGSGTSEGKARASGARKPAYLSLVHLWSEPIRRTR
jgi:hypothetical protein